MGCIFFQATVVHRLRKCSDTTASFSSLNSHTCVLTFLQTTVNVDSLDITLLMFVIRHSEILDAPKTSWDERPEDSDTSVAADLVRIKRIRNSTYAHATSDSLNKQDYDRIRKELIDVLERLIPEQKHLFTSLNTAERVEKQLEYQKQMEKGYQQDISVKQALESLNNEVSAQSRKLHYVLQTLRGIGGPLSSNVSRNKSGDTERDQMIFSLRDCYRRYLMAYRPFQGLDFEIDVTNSQTFLMECLEISSYNILSVSVETELELLFTDRKTMDKTTMHGISGIYDNKLQAFYQEAKCSQFQLKPLILIEGCRGIGKSSYLMQFISQWVQYSGPLKSFQVLLYIPFVSVPNKNNILELVLQNYFPDSSSMRKRFTKMLKYEAKSVPICFIFDFSLSSRIPESLLRAITNCRKYCSVMVAARSYALQIESVMTLKYSRRFQLQGLKEGIKFANFLLNIPNFSEDMKQSVINMLEIVPTNFLKIPLVPALVIQSIWQHSPKNSGITPTIFFQRLVNFQIQNTVSQSNWSVLQAYNSLFSCAHICYQHVEKPKIEVTSTGLSTNLLNLLELGFLQQVFNPDNGKRGPYLKCFSTFDESIHYFLAAYSISYRQPFTAGLSNSRRKFLLPFLGEKSKHSKTDNDVTSRLTVLRFLTGLAGNSQQIIQWAVSTFGVPNKFALALDLFIEVNQSNGQKASNTIGEVLRSLEPMSKSVCVRGETSAREKAGLLRYLCLPNCSLSSLRVTNNSLPMSLLMKVLQTNNSLRELVLHDLDFTTYQYLPKLLACISASLIRIVHLEFSVDQQLYPQNQLSWSFCYQVLAHMKQISLKSFSLQNFKPAFLSCMAFDLFAASLSCNSNTQCRILDLSGLGFSCAGCNLKACSPALLFYQIISKPTRSLKAIVFKQLNLTLTSCESFHTLLTSWFPTCQSKIQLIDLQKSLISVKCKCSECRNGSETKNRNANNFFLPLSDSLVTVEEKMLRDGETGEGVILDDCEMTFNSCVQLKSFNEMIQSAIARGVKFSMEGTCIRCPKYSKAPKMNTLPLYV